MIPDKFNMVDMGGIDILESQGEVVQGLYSKLVESITLCRYSCLYNWKFNAIPIAPSYVALDIKADGVWINDCIVVTEDDIIRIYSIEPEPEPVIPVVEPLSVTENGVYTVQEGIDGFNPVSVAVAQARNYSNAMYGDYKIEDITPFTKLYSTSIPYGNFGSRLAVSLGLTDESVIESNQQGGWDYSQNSFYNSEDQIGAYGGYIFNSSINITRVKFWIGRYSAQNNTLNVTVQYLAEGEWYDIDELYISPSLAYPVNVFETHVYRRIDGVRWIHKNAPNKTGGNNITFSGMTLYEKSENQIPVFIPSQGLNQIPEGYTGFATVLLN